MFDAVRARYLAFSAAMLLVATAGFLPCCGDDIEDLKLESDVSPAAVALAQKFAPTIFLARQDTRCDDTFDTDPYAPTNVGAFLDANNVRLINQRFLRDDREKKRAPSGADISSRGGDYYLDALDHRHPRNEGHRCDFERANDDSGFQPTVYARVVSHDGKTAVQYWFFYYFNDWINRHEGDYESIQLLFDGGTAREVLDRNGRPTSAAYTSHTRAHTYRWDQIRRESEVGTHPHVYVGSGSHANYAGPGFWRAKVDWWVDGCDWAVTGERARRLDPGANGYELLLFAPSRAPTDVFAWAGFGGHWGELSVKAYSGPKGPAAQDEWKNPWEWEDRLKKASFDTCALRNGGQRKAAAGARIMQQGDSFIENVPMFAGDVVAFFIGWGNSEVSLTLESPSGQMIGPDDDDEHDKHKKGDSYELYVLKNVERGVWKMHIEGTDLPTPETVTWEAWDIPPPCASVSKQPLRDADLDGIANGLEAGDDACDWDTDGDLISDGMTPQDPDLAQYFADLDRLSDEYSARARVFRLQRDDILASATSPDEILKAHQEHVGLMAASFGVFAAGADLLSPPAVVESEHDDFTEALVDLATEFTGAMGDVNASLTPAEVFARVDQISNDLGVRVVERTCRTLQGRADFLRAPLHLDHTLECAVPDTPFFTADPDAG